MTEPAGERDLNHMTFGLSLRARLRRVSFCARGKPLFQNSRFGRHRLPKRHAHGVLTSLTQRATLVVLITRQKKKQPDGLFLFCLYRAAEKDIAFKSVRHYRIPAIFGFATQPAPTLSMTAIILAIYFFNLWLIPYVPTMPFQKTILCYNSIGSRRRLTILVLAEVQLWK